MSKRSAKAKRRRYRRAKPPRRPGRGWGIGVILLLLGGLILWLGRPERPSPTPETPPRTFVSRVAHRTANLMVPPRFFFHGLPQVNVLLMGVDVNRDRRGRPTKDWARTDTILLVNVDRFARALRILSIPRDTRVRIPRYGWHKINAAHAFGGPELLLRTIEENFHLRLHHYVRTNFEGFISLVDAVGGVDLYVEKDMDYDDNWGRLHVHLKEGFQHLDGDQAQQYVRFRKDREGDLGRVKRQQKFLKALLRQALAPRNWVKLPALVKKARQYVTTDLTDLELLALANFLRSVPEENICTETLPVVSRGNDLQPLRRPTGELLAAMFGNTFDPWAWQRQPLAPPPPPAPLPEPEEPEEPLLAEPPWWELMPRQGIAFAQGTEKVPPAEGEEAEPSVIAPEELTEPTASTPPEPPEEGEETAPPSESPSEDASSLEEMPPIIVPPVQEVPSQPEETEPKGLSPESEATSGAGAIDL